jgi:Flp pilus assembly secretin CpaC
MLFFFAGDPCVWGKNNSAIKTSLNSVDDNDDLQSNGNFKRKEKKSRFSFGKNKKKQKKRNGESFVQGRNIRKNFSAADSDSIARTEENLVIPESSVYKEIEVNSVNFIKLNEKISEIFIPDPNVIDVQMLNSNSLYILGLSPGVTSLVINGNGGKSLVDCKVRVTYPLKTIKEAVFEMCPDAKIELISLDSSLVLKGKVPSPEMAADVVEIVGKFVDAAKIINKLVIETSTQVLLKVKIAEVTKGN